MIRSVLFVCLGNICRSPSAHAVFRQMANEAGMDIVIDSAGTQGYHKGAKPDGRSSQAGEARGYDFSGLHARRVEPQDFEKFDLILAMDDQNLQDLLSAAPSEHQHKIKPFMAFAAVEETQVPDPYYGGGKAFEYVLDLIESASLGLLEHVKRES